MTEKLPRQYLAEAIHKTKTAGLTTPAKCDALADAIMRGLDRVGIAVVHAGEVLDTPDEVLEMLKTTRRRLAQAIADEETPPRDLAALSRRWQEVMNDIATMEERIRAEKKKVGTGGRGTNSSAIEAARGRGAAIDV